jgi:hypothetical protein
MNHQHFKEWLISDDPLTPEQSRSLAEHIKDCESCRNLQTAWSEVFNLITATPDMEPRLGFLNRWESRLIKQRRRTQKRLTWVVFGTMTIIAFIIMMLLGYQIFEIIRSPQQIVLVFLSRVAIFISYLNITKDYVSLFSIYLPDIPVPVFVLTSGITTLLCVLWLAVIKQISTARRIVK